MLQTDNITQHLHTDTSLQPVIGKAFFTATGNYWKKVRKMVNPAFATSHLEIVVPAMIQRAMVFVDILEKVTQSGQILALGLLLPVEI